MTICWSESLRPRSRCARRQGDARLGAGHLGLQTLDLRRVGRRIDGHEEIAGLDKLAFHEVRGLDRAADAGPHVDSVDGFEPARKRVPEDDVPRLDGGD
ncbi:hypothetical protein M2440_002180 [Methylorubrum extorquens]|nr:hypothetical protein [Methylorubrum extorquens]